MTTAPSDAAQLATGFAKIGTLLRAAQWQQFGQGGLTATQNQILALLAVAGPQRVTTVAAELAVSQPTASDAVNALERKSLVQKRPDPSDARALRLYLTQEGRRAAEAASAKPAGLIAALEALPPQDRAALLKGMTAIIRSLQLQGEIPVQRLCVTCRFFRPHVHDDAAAPHHCDFVNAAFGEGQLRLDCGDHEAAPEPAAQAAWRRFACDEGADHKEGAPTAATDEAP